MKNIKFKIQTPNKTIKVKITKQSLRTNQPNYRHQFSSHSYPLKLISSLANNSSFSPEQSIKQEVVSAGYRLTQPRLAVIDYLIKFQKPISARQLAKKITTIDLASIYRVLNLLTNLRLLNKEIINQSSFYCLNLEPHHHITCRLCGRSEKFACQHQFKNIKNFIDIEHHFSLVGVCTNCR